MKRCPQCGRAYSDLMSTCSYCGSALTGNAGTESAPKPPVQQAYQPQTPPAQQTYKPTTPPVQQSYTPSSATWSRLVRPTTPPVQQSYTPPVKPVAPPVQQTRPVTPATKPATAPVQSDPAPVKPSPQENVGNGVLGALLFGLGGAVLQAVILNLGKVAAVAGIVCFLLAMLGYKKFSGIGENPSKAAPWVCAPVSLGMLFLGTVAGYAVYINNQLGIGIGNAVQIMFANSEVLEAMGSDMGMSVVLWGVSLVVSLITGRKKK